MTTSIQFTLIGLDRVGASLALALKQRPEIRLAGFDRDNGVARLAQQRGLIHQAHWNLLEATDTADLVFLGGPLADQREWLKALAPTLREGAVVATLGPLLGPPLGWAQELLPAERHGVAAHPRLNPAYLFDGALGMEAAKADLFAGGLWALAAAPHCAPEALKLLADVAGLVGAQPFFMDPAEHDGLMGGAEALPALTALALLRAAQASPGWHEMRKVADRGFATATLAVASAEAAALALNGPAVRHYLDAALAELTTLRELIAAGDQAALEALLQEAADRRAKWIVERAKGEWEKQDQPALQAPTLGETLGRMLTGGLFKREKKSG